MATIAPQTLPTGGATPTYTAAVGPDQFAATPGKTFLHLKNTNASARNVTIVSQAPTEPGRAPANKVINVPATTGDKMVPIDSPFFLDANGNVQLTYDAVTNLTVAVVVLP